MLDFLQTLVQLGICVVMPVSIVWIVFSSISKSDSRQTEVIIKAIENNPDIDAERLIEAMRKPRKTYRQIQQTRLLCACLFTLLGIAASIIAGILAYQVPTRYMHYPAMVLAGIFLAIGIAYAVVYYVGNKSAGEDKCES